MKNWYALNNQGSIKFLGRAPDFYSATELLDASNALWVVDEVDLDEWAQQIKVAKDVAAKAEAAGNARITYRAVVIDEELCYRFQFVNTTKDDTEGGIRASLELLGLHLVEYIRWDGIDPMQKDIDALVRWAKSRGVDWKDDLAYAWATGHWQRVGASSIIDSLQRLRNTPGYGPGSEFIRTLDISTYED